MSNLVLIPFQMTNLLTSKVAKKIFDTFGRDDQGRASISKMTCEMLGGRGGGGVLLLDKQGSSLVMV